MREFFAARHVLEVETPLLAPHTVSDPHLDGVAVAMPQGWLQTSPEFAMKRLLAAGSGDVYQICKAFRGAEKGRLHNPEFTLLEWYRCDFGQAELIAETAELLQALLPPAAVCSQPYASAFETQLELNPHTGDQAELRRLVAARTGLSEPATLDTLHRSDLLDLLFSHCVQPHLPGLQFIYDYPASQAALARLGKDNAGHTVARRFECFYNGIELGNGYHELTDAAELLQRHQQDNQRRLQSGKPAVAEDAAFMAAMQAGLPDCAGIAVGLDRVCMLAAGADCVSDVISFSEV